MTSRLSFKLFIVLLLVIGLVVMAMLLLMRWSFHSGFTDYLNKVEEARLERVVERLTLYLEEPGGWEAVARDPRLWQELIGEQFMHPHLHRNSLARPGDPSEMQQPGRPGHFRSPFAVGPRLSLFDAQKRPLTGPAASVEGLRLKALEVNGEVLGWVGLAPLRAPRAARDVEFFKRQAGSFYFIGGVVVLIAAVASLLLAWRLLVPIKALARGARALAKGEYRSLVPVHGRDELAQLAQDFNRLADVLAANESARRRWIADISHELRTPVAVLKGEIEALQDGVRHYSDQTLHSLHGEITRLGKLVDDLYQLSLADLGALDYHKEPLDLAPLLRKLVKSYRGRFAAAGLALRFEGSGPAPLLADPDRLAQLIQNLLENSLRYTDRGGSALVSYRIGQAEVVLDIQDSAPGVAEAALPRLFDRLYREDESRSRAKGGAGLGLAIARNIVTAHQGTIEAKHSSLGGLWIRIVLPLERRRLDE